MKEKKLKDTEQLIYKKKIKKEFEEKLHTAITAVVNECGKGKKTKSIIGKFIKQLSKKVDLNPKPHKQSSPKVTEKPSTEKATLAKTSANKTSTAAPAPTAKIEDTKSISK